MLNIIDDSKRLPYAVTDNRASHLILNEIKETVLGPGAPGHIGGFNRWSTPFAFMKIGHEIESPEAYDVIKPIVRSRIFQTPRPPKDYWTANLVQLTTVTVIFHDWLSTPEEDVYLTLYRQLNNWQRSSHFVIMVDWRNGAQARADMAERTKTIFERWYTEAALNGAVIGRDIGYMLSRMTRLSTIDLIGVGLGAHVAYFVADWYRQLTKVKVRRLTAIDPSGYAFLDETHSAGSDEKYSYKFRLVANGVDVIHASKFDETSNGYGSIKPLGMVDFLIGPMVTRDDKNQFIDDGFSDTLCQTFERDALKGIPKVHCSTEAAIQAYSVSVAAASNRNIRSITAPRCDHFHVSSLCLKSLERYKALGRAHECQAKFGFQLSHSSVKHGQYIIDGSGLQLTLPPTETKDSVRPKRGLTTNIDSFSVEERTHLIRNRYNESELIRHNFSHSGATNVRSIRQNVTPEPISGYPFSTKDFTATQAFKSGARFDSKWFLTIVIRLND